MAFVDNTGIDQSNLLHHFCNDFVSSASQGDQLFVESHATRSQLILRFRLCFEDYYVQKFTARV